MMGDNRFNSLDMRHSYDVHLAPVDKGDEWSFVYRSNLAPQYVPVSRILGSANFRFWPISRAGLPQ
jgi:signal peptidase I